MSVPCTSATGRDGRKIRVGDTVSLWNGPPVVVVRMWRQGADGTILVTAPAPDPKFPHHAQVRANHAVKAAK